MPVSFWPLFGQDVSALSAVILSACSLALLTRFVNVFLNWLYEAHARRND
jgi:hypothetical protein